MAASRTACYYYVVCAGQVWNAKNNKLTDAANEAKDNLKYLYTLEKFCESLYRCEPVCMSESIGSLINAIRMIHTISRYYNTSERMTALFIKVSHGPLPRPGSRGTRAVVGEALRSLQRAETGEKRMFFFVCGKYSKNFRYHEEGRKRNSPNLSRVSGRHRFRNAPRFLSQDSRKRSIIREKTLHYEQVLCTGLIISVVHRVSNVVDRSSLQAWDIYC